MANSGASSQRLAVLGSGARGHASGFTSCMLHVRWSNTGADALEYPGETRMVVELDSINFAPPFLF